MTTLGQAVSYHSWQALMAARESARARTQPHPGPSVPVWDRQRQAALQSAHEAALATPQGEAARQERNAATVARMDATLAAQALPDAQPVFTRCPNCGTVDHKHYSCPCECHMPARQERKALPETGPTPEETAQEWARIVVEENQRKARRRRQKRDYMRGVRASAKALGVTETRRGFVAKVHAAADAKVGG